MTVAIFFAPAKVWQEHITQNNHFGQSVSGLTGIVHAGETIHTYACPYTLSSACVYKTRLTFKGVFGNKLASARE